MLIVKWGKKKLGSQPLSMEWEQTVKSVKIAAKIFLETSKSASRVTSAWWIILRVRKKIDYS